MSYSSSRNPSNCKSPNTVDCGLQKNLCHDCCNGSYVGGTYLIPPGIFPLVCYPGRLQLTPFAVMYSPPHFLYSPPQVINSIVGVNPNSDIHRPMVYNHEPYSGSVTEVFYRLQVSMPLIRSRVAIQNRHLTESIIPIFWEDSHAVLHDDTYHMIWLGFVFVPKLVDIIKYSFAVLALALFLFVAMRHLRRRRGQVVNAQKNSDLKLISTNTIDE